MIKLGNVAAIARKEWIHIRRDPVSLVIIILMPLIQLTIFGFAVNMDIKNLPAAVINLDKGTASANYGSELVDELVAAEDSVGHKRFLVEKLAMKDGEADGETAVKSAEDRLRADLVAGKQRMGLIIPPDFTADIKAGRPASPVLLLDGSDATTSRQALFFTRGMVIKHGIKWVKARMPSFLRQFAPGDKPLVDVEEKVLFNPDLKSANFFIPGLLGVIMMMLTVVLTAVSIVREKERGSLEALVVTPIQPMELMIGKMLPNAGVALLDFMLVMGLMVYLFGISISGNVWVLFAFSFVFLYTCLAVGLMVSTAAQSQAQAFLIAMAATMLPGVLLSGFVFPRASMPDILFYIGYLIPLTYFIEILRGLILRGAEAVHLWQHVIPLLLLGIMLMGGASHRFRKQVA
ncbi:MAG: ABC transporter permease [Candidatus Sericytochromatia bacterium]|nr:ABC transporter permease [Candidatus Tanganyikabacteria bacterium]